eukprot:4990984-Lingulodinium_polyedra.AAC.1
MSSAGVQTSAATLAPGVGVQTVAASQAPGSEGGAADAVATQAPLHWQQAAMPPPPLASMPARGDLQEDPAAKVFLTAQDAVAMLPKFGTGPG